MLVTVTAAIAIGWFAPSLYQKIQGTDNDRTGNFSEHVDSQPHRLTLYGTTTCPACIQARAYLIKSRIHFNDQIIDKSEHAEKMYSKLGERSVPVFLTNSKMLIGFNPVAYRELATSTNFKP